MPEFQTRVSIRVPREYAFAWHEHPTALECLIPPWEPTRVLNREGGIDQGRVELVSGLGPIRFRLRAQHSAFERNRLFHDSMTGGPFRSWEHDHRFESSIPGDATGNPPTAARGLTSGIDGTMNVPAEATLLTDEIRYRLKGGRLAELVLGGMVRRRISRMFQYRHEITRSELEDHFHQADLPRKTIAITGAGGLVGSALAGYLSRGGHHVIRLKRGGNIKASGSATWNPDTGEISFGRSTNSVDCLVHLAGYGIADRRWTTDVRKKIRDSRILATEKLVRFLSESNRVTESFLCASATGFYGDRREETLTETSEPGVGFLPETCRDWENRSHLLRSESLRVVNLRFGMILSGRGGALRKMLLPFRCGVGGKIGSGRQFWSWISLRDVLRGIHFSIMNDKVVGPVNLVSPAPIPQRQFARTLGKVLWRPSLVPLPGFMAKLVMGEMAKDLLLASARVIPEKLSRHGFRFLDSDLENALRLETGNFTTSLQRA